MAQAKVLSLRSAARQLGTYRGKVLVWLADGTLTRAEMDGKTVVEQDHKYEALLAERTAPAAA